MTFWHILFRMPWHILLIAVALVIVGALALYSASEGSWQPWAGRHALRGAVGVGVVLLMAFVDFKLLHRVSYVLLIVMLIVLSVLLLIGSGPRSFEKKVKRKVNNSLQYCDFRRSIVGPLLGKVFPKAKYFQTCSFLPKTALGYFWWGAGRTGIKKPTGRTDGLSCK